MSFSVLPRWLFSLKLGRQVTFPATIILQISMRSLQSGEFCHRSWGCASFSVYPRGQHGSDRNTVRVVCLWLILDTCTVSSGASHVRIPTSIVAFVGSFSFSITIMLPAIVEQCNGKWTGSHLEFFVDCLPNIFFFFVVLIQQSLNNLNYGSVSTWNVCNGKEQEIEQTLMVMMETTAK